MHLNDEQIQRYLHGELSSRERADVAEHVAECELCAGRLAEAEREEQDVFGLLERLDHKPLRHDINSVMSANREDGRATRNVWVRRVAVLVLIAALGGAAYAFPGSPLPGWIDKLTGDSHDQVVPRETTTASDSTTSTLVPAVSGIAIPPPKRFSIVFAAPQDSGMVYLTPSEGLNIVIRAVGGAPRFTLSSADRLEVDNTGLNSSYEIEIPKASHFVELIVGDRRVILKDGLRFGEDLLSDEQGRRVVPLTPLQ